MHKRIPIIIDTDISLGTPNAEIDDGGALMFLAQSPQVKIKAITAVHGNASMEIVLQNLIHLLHALDFQDIPVGKGAAEPLAQDLEWAMFLEKWQSNYGPTPSKKYSLPDKDGIDLMIETICEYAGEIVILAIGPLTNLAIAFQRKPEVISMIRCVYAMGGNLSDKAPAEFNIRCDPEAAKIVLQSGVKIKLHGLNITRQVHFSREDFSGLSSTSHAQNILKEQAFGWIEIVEAQGWEQGGCSLHDAIAAAAIVEPGLIEYSTGALDVITDSGPERGKIKSLTLDDYPEVLIARKINKQACHNRIITTIKEN